MFRKLTYLPQAGAEVFAQRSVVGQQRVLERDQHTQLGLPQPPARQADRQAGWLASCCLVLTYSCLHISQLYMSFPADFFLKDYKP